MINLTTIKYPFGVVGRTLCVVLVLLVSGCGFSPVYSTNGAGVGPVSISEIDGRAGYFLRQELDRYAALERGSTPQRTLTVKLVTNFASAALGVDGLSARTLYTLTANYSLESNTGGKPLVGVVSTTVGYESLDQAYGDVALQADAEQRAATQVADRVWADLRRQARLPQ
jgi:LPS-assembly lipoprotein